MKKVVSLVLVVAALFVSGAVFYDVLASGCQKGISYSIGQIASEFGIEQEVVLEVADEAAGIWNEAVGEEVITYDPKSKFAISFIFDDRQESTIVRQQDELTLDNSRGSLAKLTSEVEELQAKYNKAQDTYQASLKAYTNAQNKYNQKVEAMNNGEVPREDMEDERQSLKGRHSALDKERIALNQLAQEVNKKANEVNEQVKDFNSGVNDFNESYGAGSDTFKQGIYDGKGIEVYQYENPQDLLGLLVHEFGHALGIDHVEDKMAVMYYLQHNSQDNRINLTDDDLKALSQACEVSPLSVARLKEFLADY